MHIKSRMELRYEFMTQSSKTKVCRRIQKSRMELGCALMTLKSKSEVSGIQKKSRMELRCALMILMRQYEQGLWNARIEQNRAGMRADDPKE